MDKKRSDSFIKYLEKEWAMDLRIFLDLNDTLFSACPENTKKFKIWNEFSFVFNQEGQLDRKVGVANLLYFSKSFPDNRYIQNARIKAILDFLEVTKKKYSLPFDVEATRKLFYFNREIPKRLLQIGLEMNQKGKVRIKLYFENERPDEDYLLIKKFLEQVCRELGMTYNNSLNFIIFRNKIGIIGVDLAEQGYGIKLYDYFHSPSKKELADLFLKYELFFDKDKNCLYQDFKKKVFENNLFTSRNVDILFVCRFLPNSTRIDSMKIDVYLSSLPDAKSFFRGTKVLKKNQEMFDFFEKNKAKVSFIGHELEKMFFYVR
jgi:hypothetical protein